MLQDVDPVLLLQFHPLSVANILTTLFHKLYIVHGT